MKLEQTGVAFTHIECKLFCSKRTRVCVWERELPNGHASKCTSVCGRETKCVWETEKLFCSEKCVWWELFSHRSGNKKLFLGYLTFQILWEKFSNYFTHTYAFGAGMCLERESSSLLFDLNFMCKKLDFFTRFLIFTTDNWHFSH